MPCEEREFVPTEPIPRPCITQLWLCQSFNDMDALMLIPPSSRFLEQFECARAQAHILEHCDRNCNNNINNDDDDDQQEQRQKYM